MCIRDRYNYVDLVAEKATDVTFYKAHYLSDQDHVINTFVERIAETEAGNMEENHDLMASFKERLSLGEVDIHHHHAEFQPFTDPEDDQFPGGEDHCDDHGHGHSHDHGHGHSHGVYKHIAHPNGPRTMIDQGVCGCFMGQFPDYVVEEERKLIAQRKVNG